MRIHVVHSCGHAVVVRRYSAFMDRAEMKATLELRPCEKCALEQLTRAIQRRTKRKDREKMAVTFRRAERS